MALQEQRQTATDLVMELRDCSFYYGSFRAVADVSLPIYQNKITAFIGPSGCGKSTVLREASTACWIWCPALASMAR